MTRIILSPHKDDETVCLGGSIAKWSSLGDRVFVVFFFPGGSVCRGEYVSTELREEEAQKASAILGFDRVYIKSLDGFEDRGHLAEIKDAVADVEALFKLVPPGALSVYFPSASENQDHKFVYGVAQILMRATAVSQGIWFWEYPPYYDSGGLEGTIIDVTLWIDRKKEALEVYGSQMRKMGGLSVRGILSYNRALGEIMVPGIDEGYAEKVILRRSYE